MYVTIKKITANVFTGMLLLTVVLVSVLAAQDRERVLVRFQDTGELLNNPGKGLMVFQTNTQGNLVEQNYRNYPDATITYFRVYWRFLEPEQGAYRWDLIDRALATARERGQTVMLAFVSHGSPYVDATDVPDWYREMVGERREWAFDSPVNAWMVDPEDPRYHEYFGGFVRKAGERYDGHPDVEAVDTRIVGAWGEGAGSSMLSQKTREALIGAYTDSFQETPLIMLLTDEKTNKFGLSQADVGWRVDCMGDIGFWADEQDGWTHMYDSYPQRIIETGMHDAWKKGHVSLEICYNFTGWKERGNFTMEEVAYIFEQGLKWRMSSFNAKNAPVPEEWQPMVDEWVKQMGYRFVPRRISYPREVGASEKLKFTTWWENKGVAPIYRQFPLAFRLRNVQSSTVLLTDVDIRDWMPGDNLYDDAVFIPHDTPPGEYELEMALVEPVRFLGIEPKPSIQLPIDGRTDDGWYRLGPMSVTRR